MKPLQCAIALVLIQGLVACKHQDSINGIWYSQRDGEIKVLDDGINKTIQVVNDICYEVTNSLSYGVTLSYEAIEQHSIRQDNQLTFQLLRPRPVSYQLIDDVTDVCPQGLRASLVTDKNIHFDAQSLFRIYWQDMENHYAFFEQRQIDWKGIYIKYYDDLYGATEEQLIMVFDEILAKIKDGHSSFTIPSNEESKETLEINYYNKLTLEDKLELEAKSLGISDAEVEKYTEEESKKITLNIMQYLNEDDQQAFKERADCENKNHSFNWGSIDNQGVPTGYIRLNHFMSYITDNLIEENPKLNIDKAHHQFEELVTKILTQLSDTQGLIIDIRDNMGGFDIQGLWLLQYLIEEQQSAWHISSYFKGELHHDIDVLIRPSHKASYTNPIILLTSSGTFSAAETFASAMKTIPHVTIIGEATEGATSDSFGRMLPNGWEYSLSNLYYQNSDNVNDEVSGIQPDHAIESFTLEDRKQRRDTVIEKALSLLLD